MEFEVPNQKLSDSLVWEGTDRIDVCRTAVVLCEVAPQQVIQMQRGQLDEESFSMVFLKGELSNKVGENHSGSSLSAR